jgi:dienelactone hydrolase
LLDTPDWLERLQERPRSVPEDADRPAPVLFDGTNRPIADREAWERRRRELRAAWTRALGEIPIPRDAPALEVIEEDQLDGGAITRRLVRYEAEPGLPIEGYLLRPAGDEAKQRPGIAVFHSTTDSTIRQPAGLDGPEDKHIGVQMARRGSIAFCPRNFLWQYGRPGELGSAVEWLRKQHPGVTGMAKMLYDARRAVDALTGVPGVDAARIGAIGHSLGAKEALYLAAFDERVKAAVASEGGVGVGYSNWDAPWYLGEQVTRPGFGLDHAQVLALAAPRAVLLIGGDSADGARSWPYVEAARPAWELYGRGEAVGLLNHGRGHEYPEEAREAAGLWLGWFLGDEVR